MKRLIFLFAILSILIFATVVSQNYYKYGNPFFLNGKKSGTATIDKHTFKLLLAKTSQAKEIGLSKRDYLAKDTGMLFIFDTADYHAFWAKDMRFPIDILFIDNNRIVTIFQDVKPQKDQGSLPILKPKEVASLVLEINAGLSKKYKFHEGDLVKVENLQ